MRESGRIFILRISCFVSLSNSVHYKMAPWVTSDITVPINYDANQLRCQSTTMPINYSSVT